MLFLLVYLPKSSGAVFIADFPVISILLCLRIVSTNSEQNIFKSPHEEILLDPAIHLNKFKIEYAVFFSLFL